MIMCNKNRFAILFNKERMYLQLIFLSVLSWCAWSEVVQIESGEIPSLEYLDRDVNPCDDFYKFSCGNFENVHPLPDGAENWDHFSILQEQIHEIAKAILQSERLENEPKSVQKAKAFYTSCLDVNYIDKLTFNLKQHPLLNVIETIGKWPLGENDAIKPTWNAIGDIIAEYGLDLFFSYQITTSFMNASENVLFISKDLLTNPDAGIIERQLEAIDYLSTDHYEEFLKDIAAHVRQQSNIDNEEIKEIIEFINLLNNGGILPTNITIEPLMPEITLNELQIWTDKYFDSDLNLNWIEFLNHIVKYSGVKVDGDTKILQSNITHIYGILNLYYQSTGKQLMNFIHARLMTNMAPDSDLYMRQSLFNFYNALGYKIYEREDYCIRKTLGYPGNLDLSFALTYQYQNEYYNSTNLIKVGELLNDLHETFLHILRDTEWMDDESRVKAISKAENIITLLGYPVWSRDGSAIDAFYDNLRICTWDHFGNAQRLKAFRYALKLSEIGKVRDRRVWNLSPMEVNAFYNRGNNRILLPIAILNAPFFNGRLSIFDYARIGSVIGHEITHGFDNSGRSYGDDGTIANWWSNSTLEEFNKRTDCFKQQYAEYYIDEIEKFVNSMQTLNENLADNGGIRIAYKAYKQYEQRTNIRFATNEFTAEQLFFIAYSTMWCAIETPAYLERIHLTNVYAPTRYRVIGALSNMHEFAMAFDCKQPNPTDKCVLW